MSATATMLNSAPQRRLTSESARRPRLGFAGVGWIGTHRLRAIANDGRAEIAAIADKSTSAVEAALEQVPDATSCERVSSFDDLLRAGLDGIVIATPSAAHAEQACAALEAGHAVFCQKPLARTVNEARRVIDAARANDRLLHVDFCYRKVAGVSDMKTLIASGALGPVYAADLVFHNAYGPDKPWFFDVGQSGGGCLMDLGIHLVDLLLWVLEYPAVEHLSAALYHGGKRLHPPLEGVENFCSAELRLANDLTARLACSWHLSAGCDAVIEASFYGPRGAARLRNVGGSFYDFNVEHCEGTRHRALRTPSTEWGGIAICEWARRLTESARFDSSAERLLDVHQVLDGLYSR